MKKSIIIYILFYFLIDHYTLNYTNLDISSTILTGFLPLKIYKDLTSTSTTEKLKIELHRVGGVYGLVNISDPKNIKQYIGSSKDLYHRLSDHLKGRESKSRLQRSISKYGIEKMKKIFLIKDNHPMYGKKHDEFTIAKIRKPGVLNPMYGKKHTILTKEKMSLAKSKSNLGLYNIDSNLIKTFINQIELAKYLNLSKTTISRYLKSGNLLLNKYFLRKIK